MFLLVFVNPFLANVSAGKGVAHHQIKSLSCNIKPVLLYSIAFKSEDNIFQYFSFHRRSHTGSKQQKVK